MDPSRTEIELIRERNRIAKRRSRARQRQRQNGVSGDEDQSQNMGSTSEVTVRTSGSPVASDGSSSAGTYGHIEPDHESPGWIYTVPPVTPVTPATPVDPSLGHVQFDSSHFATCLTMDPNDLDLSPFEATSPYTAFGSNTSPGFSSLSTVYQQPADVNTRNGSSLLGLLHLAVRNGSKAIAQSLLTAGASANTRDDTGALPLHLAVQHRRRSIADLLLTYGADPDAVNAEGITPLELAVRCRDEDIVNLLISRGARIT